MTDMQGEVRFDRVCFAYAGGTPVLRDMTFHVPAGSLCAVVGPSGAGKSTMADLLLRFHDPDAGSVTIDGVDLREIRFADLRRHVAVVEQTPYLFRASLRDNIAYGVPGATQLQIQAACVAACIHEVIQALPGGYGTILAERGNTLSVGERQRVALARALLRNPRILILDEPSSALDPVSEAALSLALQGMLHERTVLLITHRMSLVQAADIVLVIRDGSIVEAGTPEQLLTQPGLLTEQFHAARHPVTA